MSQNPFNPFEIFEKMIRAIEEGFAQMMGGFPVGMQNGASVSYYIHGMRVVIGPDGRPVAFERFIHYGVPAPTIQMIPPPNIMIAQQPLPNVAIHIIPAPNIVPPQNVGMAPTPQQPNIVPPPTINRDPEVEVMEKDDQIVVLAELHGINQNTLRVLLANGGKTLIISAEGRDRKYYKEIELPAQVDVSNARAIFNNGVLYVTLTKLGGVPGKEIKVEFL